MRSIRPVPSPRIARALAGSLGLALAAGAAGAQGPIVYPAKGQSAEQQQKDEAECHVWAVQKTGFDPANAAPPVAAAPPPTTGAVRGAARGAAVGAVGGAIAGDAGKGAAVGAGVGAAGGAIRKRGQEQQAAAAQQNAQASQDAQRTAYQNARSACLEGRGYTVK